MKSGVARSSRCREVVRRAARGHRANSLRTDLAEARQACAGRRRKGSGCSHRALQSWQYPRTASALSGGCAGSLKITSGGGARRCFLWGPSQQGPIAVHSIGHTDRSAPGWQSWLADQDCHPVLFSQSRQISSFELCPGAEQGCSAAGSSTLQAASSKPSFTFNRPIRSIG